MMLDKHENIMEVTHGDLIEQSYVMVAHNYAGPPNFYGIYSEYSLLAIERLMNTSDYDELGTYGTDNKAFAEPEVYNYLVERGFYFELDRVVYNPATKPIW